MAECGGRFTELTGIMELTKTKRFGLLLGSLLAMQAHAALITGTTASVVAGGLNNGSTVGVIVDGLIPGEGTHYFGGSGGAPKNASWGAPAGPYDTVLQVDLGAVYRLDDVLVSVDNNDVYHLTYSVDGLSFSSLFSIAFNVGEINSGMDTFTTWLGDPEYVAALDFAAVDARYLRVSASAGDGRYSVGEIQAFGSPVPAGPGGSVPEPQSLALALLALGTATVARRRRQA